METPFNQPSAVTPLELLKRQVRDWEKLLSELRDKQVQESSEELTSQIAYCEERISELNHELSNYQFFDGL